MDISEPLSAELREAEQELKSTLEEACATNLSRANTGELIRVEEMLSIASEAAKKAISIRRRRHLARRDTAEQAHAAASVRRSFTDDDGITWAAWAIQPGGDRSGARARLLGELQGGWLTFESATSKRRLSPIPDGWERLDDPGLRALLREAHDAPPLRRNDERRD